MGSDKAITAKGKPPVSRDPRVVRERILAAAQAEFMRVGYAAANTNRIAERHGISKATIFRHFASKQELFEAVVESIAARWRHGIAVDAITATDPRAWLVTFATAALERILDPEALFVGRMAVSEGHEHAELRNLWPRLATRPVLRTLTARLADWQREGRIGAGDVDRLATAFLDLTLSGVVSRALYGWTEKPDAAEITRHAAICADLFLHGCTTALTASEQEPKDSADQKERDAAHRDQGQDAAFVNARL